MKGWAEAPLDRRRGYSINSKAVKDSVLQLVPVNESRHPSQLELVDEVSDVSFIIDHLAKLLGAVRCALPKIMDNGRSS